MYSFDPSSSQSLSGVADKPILLSYWIFLLLFMNPTAPILCASSKTTIKSFRLSLKIFLNLLDWKLLYVIIIFNSFPRFKFLIVLKSSMRFEFFENHLNKFLKLEFFNSSYHWLTSSCPGTTQWLRTTCSGVRSPTVAPYWRT